MKCIGTSKDTYGLGCRTEQKDRRLGLGIECGCYSDFLRNTPQGQERIKRISLSVTKPRRDLEKAEEEHKKNKSLNYLLTNTRNICHDYIKLRDKHKPCISCGQPWHSDFQAGHFYKAELFSTLKFEELNIHGQCPGCNIGKEGNESEYRVNLPKRIGLLDFNYLNALADKDHSIDFKWDREVLKEVRAYYKNKIKELHKKEK